MKMKLMMGGLILALIGCQPEPDNQRLLDDLVVTTNYDTQLDFRNYSTYAMPTDTIGFVSNGNPDDTIMVQGNDGNFPRPVLQRLEANLNDMGFTRVPKTENPDIGVNVYIVNDLNVFQQIIDRNYYYSGYYGYNSYFYYPPYINTYAQNTGALVVELVDLKNMTSNRNVKVIWNAYMGDVYSTVDLIRQAEEAIDQAFLQSPYLDRL